MGAEAAGLVLKKRQKDIEEQHSRITMGIVKYLDKKQAAYERVEDEFFQLLKTYDRFKTSVFPTIFAIHRI